MLDLANIGIMQTHLQALIRQRLWTDKTVPLLFAYGSRFSHNVFPSS